MSDSAWWNSVAQGYLNEIERLRARAEAAEKALAERPLLEVGPGVLSIPDMQGLAEALRGGDERVALENEVVSLRARLAEATEVLRSIEWADNSGDEYTACCPACGSSAAYPVWAYGKVLRTEPAEPHKPDCRLARVLKGDA